MNELNDWLTISKTLVKIFFYILVPGIAVFFRIRKKIKTGFTVGIVLTSFVLGLFGVASIAEDPFSRFERHINNKNHAEAKRSLKIIIQYGPEYVDKINENKIVYKDLFFKIKKEIINEYSEIAGRYLKKYHANFSDCSELDKNMEHMKYLNHAKTLIKFSESIGGNHDTIKKELLSRIEQGEKLISSLNIKCEKKE